MKNLLIIIAILTTITSQAQEIVGQWNGLLEIQGTEIAIIFNVEQEGDNYTATMDSPDQGAMGIPTTTTTFVDNTLTISAEDMKMKYEGQFSEEDNLVKGTFNQGPMSLPLNLTRTPKAKKEQPRRAQDPVDIGYIQEEVKFLNKEGGHHLAGTLTIPTDKQFSQVVVLISGSGPQNRNEEVAQFNHRPFLVLSDYLTRNGIAVLRYDDRGVGESEGDYAIATSKDFATDAAAAVAYLKSRKDMKGKKIGLAGHSEGGMIAPIVASENSQAVDFIALLAGPGIAIPDLLLLQSEKIGAAQGAPKEMLDANNLILAKVYDYIKTNSNLEKDELKAGLMTIFEANFEHLPEDARNSIGENKTAFFESQIEGVTGDWFLYFARFNPADYLTKVTCPVLAINGELDLQVTPKENLKGIADALTKAGNTNVTIKEFENQNHLFQVAKTGAPSEYGTIEETFNEDTMQYISDWIKGNK